MNIVPRDSAKTGRLSDLVSAPNASVALIANDNSLATYGDIRQTLLHAKASLNSIASAGTRPVVATLLPDAPSTALALLALCERCVAAPINPALTEAEILTALKRVGAGYILAHQGDGRAERIGRTAGLGEIHLTPRPENHCADFDLTAHGITKTNSGRIDDVAMILSTSGSTGAPKAVPLTGAMLQHSTKTIAKTLQLSADDTVVHVLPMFHIGAVVDLLLTPLSAGGRVRFAQPFSSADFAEAIITTDATWAQAVPTMLSRLLAEETPDLAAACRSLRFIRSVSSDLSPETQAAFEDRLGVPLVQMYGMTETAGQIASNPLPPGMRKPGSVGRPDGADVVILDRHANPLPVGTEGEICVRGPGVTAGYLGTDRTNDFVGDWLRTGDQGYLDADGDLFLTGRLKEIINRGGEKISPLEIERRLLAHPNVTEAAAIALPHTTLGEEPAAAVVVSGESTSEAMLIDWLSDEIAAFKMPRRMTIYPALPRLGSGKVDKRALRADMTDTAPTAAVQASQSATERTVSRIWARALNVAPPRRDEDFFDAGGDSISAQSFARALEAAIGHPLPANILYDHPRFDALCAALDQEIPQDAAPELPVFTALRQATLHWPGQRPDAASLFVAHGRHWDAPPLFFSTGGIAMSQDFVATMSETRPIYLCRPLSKLKGRFGRSLKTNANNHAVAERLATEINALQPDGPVHLGGYCQGAVQMDLVARRLLEMGRTIGIFVIVDRFFDAPLPYPAVIGWTPRTRFSARGLFVEPERRIDWLFPSGASVVSLDTAHLKALTGGSATLFAEAVTHAMTGDSKPQATWSHAEAVEALKIRRDQLYHPRINAKLPRITAPDQPLRLSVDVANLSQGIWEPTCDSGLRLQAAWRNLDGHLQDPMAGHAPLLTALEPGATQTLLLDLRVPSKRRPYQLVIDMVDDGLGWFHRSSPKRPFKRTIWPLRPRQD